MLEVQKWPHHFHISPAVVPHMEKVYSIIRKIYGQSPTDDLNDLDVNTAVWGVFLNVTLQEAVHLGRDHLESLRFTKNQLLKSVKQLSLVTEKLIEDQKEISNLTTIDHEELTWRSTSLLCDNAFEITNAQTYIFADSVLCLGTMSDLPVEAWKNKKMVFGNSLSQRSESNRWRTDGVPMENISRAHYIECSRRDSTIYERTTV